LRSSVQKVRHLLPRDHADALTYAVGQYIGICERLLPPTASGHAGLWPLPLVVADWPYVEWVLQLEPVNPNYRDHLVHSLRVATIGRWLTEQFSWANPRQHGNRGPLAQAAAKPERVRGFLKGMGLGTPAMADRVVVAAWWIAALFHDVGYAVWLLGKLERSVGNALPWYAGDIVGGLVRGCDRGTIERSLFRPFLEGEDARGAPHSVRRRLWEVGLYRELLDNHSVASALALLMSLDVARAAAGSVVPEVEIAFHLAAEAVAYHDSDDTVVAWEEGGPRCDQARRRVVSPLGCLLRLCDDLQVWGRLSLVPEYGDDGLVRMRPAPCPTCIRVEAAPGPPCSLHVDRGMFAKLNMERLDLCGAVMLSAIDEQLANG
jgi:hypothetical protein